MNWLVLIVAMLLAWVAFKLVVGVLKFVIIAAIVIAAGAFIVKKLR